MTNEDAVSAFAKAQGINAEMFAPAVGGEPLWIGADPVGGWIYLLRVEYGTVTSLARWTAVQAENITIMHERAKTIVSFGIGSMR